MTNCQKLSLAILAFLAYASITFSALGNPQAGRREISGYSVGPAIGIGTAIIIDQLSRQPPHTSVPGVRKPDTPRRGRAARKDEKKKDPKIATTKKGQKDSGTTKKEKADTTTKKEGGDGPKATKKKDSEPVVTGIDCVVYFKYDPDTPERLHAPENGVANNADLKGSANAYAASLLGPEGPSGIKLAEFSGKDFPAAVKAFPPPGKCCRTFAIFSHGFDNGALDLPYDIPNTALDKADKDAGVAHQLGGPHKGKPGLSAHYAKYIEAMKAALCKDDTKVVFNSCHTARGIAPDTSASLNVPTSGFTGVCSYPQDTTTKKYLLPRPKNDGSSKEESFNIKPLTTEELLK